MPFPPGALSASNAERNRNLGLALVDAARKTTSGPSGQPLAELALPLLDAATAGDPRDVPAWEAKASALMLAGRADAAVAACDAVLAMDPERETTLFLAGVLAMGQKRPDDARLFAERAIRVNPWMWQYHQMLATARVQLSDWQGAANACRQAIKLEPANLPCRELLMRCYLRLGDKSGARGALEACLALMPPAEREDFRRVVEQQLR
jgi:tetratricopeptide (TPR) repeat protein